MSIRPYSTQHLSICSSPHPSSKQHLANTHHLFHSSPAYPSIHPYVTHPTSIICPTHIYPSPTHTSVVYHSSIIYPLTHPSFISCMHSCMHVFTDQQSTELRPWTRGQRYRESRPSSCLHGAHVSYGEMTSEHVQMQGSRTTKPQREALPTWG